jgi:hypothetical protein
MPSHRCRSGSPALLLVLLLCAACGTVQPKANERYELTATPLLPAKIAVLDKRPDFQRQAHGYDGGYVVGDSRISPAPADFLASEITKLVTTDDEFKVLAPRVTGQQVSLTKFTVGTQIRGVTTNSSQPPGMQAVDYAMKSLAARIDRELVIELEIEVDGKPYGTRVTWTTKWNPPSQAATFPASYAVRTVLDMLKSGTVAR